MPRINKLDPDRRLADSRNRAERRRDAAEMKKQAKADKIPPARADGRPLYFMVPPDGQHGAVCWHCEQLGLAIPRYKYGEVVMNDPANPPEGRKKGEVFTICKYHLPDNAVIFNPRTGFCHNKAGDEEWIEQ